MTENQIVTKEPETQKVSTPKKSTTAKKTTAKKKTTTAKKTATAKTTTKADTSTTGTAKKPATKKAASTKKTKTVNATSEEMVMQELTSAVILPEERLQMIAETAYYRAEQRGFDPSGHEQDWLEAEKIVDEMLSKDVKKTESMI